MGSGDVVVVVVVVVVVDIDGAVVGRGLGRVGVGVGSAQGDNDKACTTSDASSTILTRIAHRTYRDRRTQGHYMPVPCPCRVHAA